MADLTEIMTRLVSNNQAARERSSGIVSRTVSAILSGDIDELTAVVQSAASDRESSDQPVEDGDANGPPGDTVSATPPA